MSEPVSVDPLFLGMTRPPMALGVTYTFLVVNGVSSTIAFLGLNSLWAWLMALPIHALGVMACLKDPRFFDLWRVFLTKTPRNRTFGYWRSNSYQG
ncbi:MAG: type IV secretion system protein VirB3 [Pseudomonadota bacterium]